MKTKQVIIPKKIGRPKKNTTTNSQKAHAKYALVETESKYVIGRIASTANDKVILEDARFIIARQSIKPDVIATIGPRPEFNLSLKLPSVMLYNIDSIIMLTEAAAKMFVEWIGTGER